MDDPDLVETIRQRYARGESVESIAADLRGCPWCEQHWSTRGRYPQYARVDRLCDEHRAEAEWIRQRWDERHVWTCRVCGKDWRRDHGLYSVNPPVEADDRIGVCSDECRRIDERDRGRRRRGTQPGPRKVGCGHCGESFEAQRPDAVYCSSRCRTAAHRQARRQG